MTSYIDAACTVYCEGPLLQAVQLAQVYNDSKTFVDMPMINDPDITLAAFNELSDPTNVTQLQDFMSEYFLPAGSDLKSWVPTDFTDSPSFLDDITDADYRSWGSDLNQLWLVLGREVDASVQEHPQRHSYVPRNYPMIVPGGRFRESYYWDSWWIVRGLLVCDMSTTAMYVINNLISDVNTFGFVPNGGRIYYLDRSQPPLLSEMVRSYTTYMIDQYGTTENIQDYLGSAYNALTTEYAFWMDETKGHCVTMPTTASGVDTIYRLNRFYSNYTTPRPESYLADYQHAHESHRDLAEYYRQVRAGAETGWDFSSRWIEQDSSGVYNITNIQTNEIVPIDLNSIMYRFELNMASFATQLAEWAADAGNSDQADIYNSQASAYTAAADLRSAAINLYMWDAASKHWRDFNLTSGHWAVHGGTSAAASALLRTARNNVRTSSSTSSSSTTAAAATLRGQVNAGSTYSTVAYWVPMWAGLMPSDSTTADDLVASLQSSGLLQPGGVLTTTVETGQQWDAPDAWPPEVLLTIEGLQTLNTENSLNLATEITQLWLNTCYIAYNRTSYMYEKYNAYHVGVGGGGGEYRPQVGFGWSNSVALILLQQMYPPSSSGGDDGLSQAQVIAIACIVTFVVVLGVVMGALQVYLPTPKAVSDGAGGAVDLQPISPQVTASNSMHSKSSVLAV